MLHKTYLTLSLFLLACSISFAQDRLVLLPNLDTLQVRVKEIGSDQIYFYHWAERSLEKLDSVGKNRVGRLLFENGRVLRFAEIETPNMVKNHNSLYYVDFYPNNAIKIDWYSFLCTTTSLALERRIDTKSSMEFGLGIMGLGLKNEKFGDKKGLMLRAGYKYYLKPYVFSKVHPAPRLKGLYVRADISANTYKQPEIQFEIINSSITNPEVVKKDLVFSRYGCALVLNLGNQMIVKSRYCLDVFMGLGIGAGGQKVLKETKTYYQKAISDLNMRTIYLEDDSSFSGIVLSHSSSPSLAFQFGFKVGYLFYGPKQTVAK